MDHLRAYPPAPADKGETDNSLHLNVELLLCRPGAPLLQQDLALIAELQPAAAAWLQTSLLRSSAASASRYIFDSVEREVALQLTGWLCDYVAEHELKQHSARRYAYELEHFANWCVRFGCDPLSASKYDLNAYRESMLFGTDPTASATANYRPPTPETINGRLRRVLAFYAWQVKKGLRDEVPIQARRLHVSNNRHAGILAHLSTGASDNSTHYSTKNAQIIVLSPSDASKIITGLREPYRLISKVALCVGLRRFEILGLTVHKILNLPADDAKSSRVWIDVAKGNSQGLVIFPSPILKALRRYIAVERRVIVDQARYHAMELGESFIEPSALFLCSWEGMEKKKKDLSMAERFEMLSQAVTQEFQKAAKAAGIEANFHDLRHHFATMLLRHLRARGEPHPEKIVSMLLRHANLKTTMDMYVHVAEESDVALSDSVDDLYNNISIAAGNSWAV